MERIPPKRFDPANGGRPPQLRFAPFTPSAARKYSTQILKLINLVAQGKWDAPKLYKLFRDHESVAEFSELAFQEDKLIGLTLGYASVYTLGDKEIECIFGRRMCIDEKLQRSKLGTKMFDRVADKVIRSRYGPNYPVIWVTAQTNVKSTRFYARAGFIPVAEIAEAEGHTNNIYLATAREIKEKLTPFLR